MYRSEYGDASAERIIFPPIKETWHEPINNIKISGFVIDMLPYTAKRMVNRKLEYYSAVRLFVNTVGSMRRKYTFLVRYNPYFYFIAKNDQDEEALRYVLELKRNKLPETEGIFKIDKVQAHILTNTGHYQRFLHNSIVYKLILHDPNDVPKYASALKKCNAIKDVREYDIPYQHRVGMDLGIYVGKKYKFVIRNGIAELHELIDDNELPLLDTFIFDIEVRKKPVHPPKDDDPIDILGLQINEKGYLFNNVELTYFEIPDFWLGVKETEAEMTIENEKDEPQAIKERRDVLVQLTEEEATGQTWKNKPIFFKTINCINEKHLLNEFKNFIIKAKPDYVSGFNSDRFDFPHIIARSKIHGIKYEGLLDYDKWEEAYTRSGAIFADAWHWVDRDAYLSKGMRGLKAATLQKMDIYAMETDHEQQVREWVHIRDVLLNAENEMHVSWENTVKEMLVPDNDAARYEKIKDITERNRKLAFDRAFRFARYCASDVYVTDLMIRRFVVNFNLAVSTLIPMTVFETSRKPRGPMVELILLKGMQGTMIAPNKIIKEKHYTINPLDIKQQYNEIYVSLNKKIDDEDFDYWVPLLTRNEMVEHCKGCANAKCQMQWKDIWGKNLASQKPIRCSRDSPEDDPENDAYYAPLNGGKMIVDNPKYEGAFVHCYQSGIFKDNEAYKFKIDVEYLKKIEDKFISTITENFKNFENTPYKVQEGVYTTAKICDKEKILEKVHAQFASIYDHIIVENGKTYWIGLPNLVHVDVSSMYPNIIITYNLQPYGVVTEKDCAECPYHWKKCGDPCECWYDIKWSAVDEVWNIESIDVTKALNEIESIKSIKGKKDRRETDDSIKKTFKSYVKGQKQINEYKYPITSRFCQKAHKLFTNTVLNFRNGRYAYKYKGAAAEDEMRRYRSLIKENTDPNNTPVYEKKVNDLSMQKIYYESMQLGLKVLLNSVHPDDTVVIKDKNDCINLWKIGHLFNSLAKFNTAFDHEDGSIGVRGGDNSIWNGESFVALKGVIAHASTQNLYMIKTENNHHIRVTKGHSLIQLDDKLDFIEIRGDKIKDYVIIASNTPFITNSDLNYIPTSIIAQSPLLNEKYESTMQMNEIITLLDQSRDPIDSKLQNLLKNGYRFDRIICVDEIESPKFVYDASVKTNQEIYTVNSVLSHNTFYGYLAGPSARFRSIPAAGGTCGRGRDIIMHAIRFCEPFAINIELDTDGIWSALPSVLPTQIKYEFNYIDPVKKIDETGKGKIKIFNDILNKEILKAFGNTHNYEPCSADGIIRNNGGTEFDPSSDQNVHENQIYNYERDPEWWNDPHWKNVPKCSISFDFEGPYSFIYLYRKKRMKASQRNEKNPLIQEDTTVTGLDELRKGELLAVQELSKNVTELGKQGRSLKTRYEKIVAWINENLLDPIQNKTLKYEYIMESKDISQDTSDKVNSAYKLYQNFLKKYEIDPASMPLHDYALEKACDTDVKKEIAIGKKGFFTKMKGQAYTMTAVRTIDLGNPINPEDSVQWFICKYPQWFIQSRGKMVKHQAKTSQRAIPINVFNASPDEIRKYMKQWIGQIPIKLRDADGKIEYAYKDPDSIKIEDYIDWDYYLDRIESRIKYYAIKPAKNQGYDLIRMGLHVRAFNEEKKEKGKESLLNAFMGMAVRKSK